MKYEFLAVQPTEDVLVKKEDLLDPNGNKWSYIRNLPFVHGGYSISMQETLIIYQLLEWLRENNVIYDEIQIYIDQSDPSYAIDLTIRGQFVDDESFFDKFETDFTWTEKRINNG